MGSTISVEALLAGTPGRRGAKVATCSRRVLDIQNGLWSVGVLRIAHARRVTGDSVCVLSYSSQMGAVLLLLSTLEQA
ncbi:MAG: hypothetical protein A2Y76_15755 [Planctomycetes bacterium RBG_13_60_9]|nr:MAG: hypothetical protein A2Y76_15755 [Planctomycetes bacterium RBG_13_60_9]